MSHESFGKSVGHLKNLWYFKIPGSHKTFLTSVGTLSRTHWNFIIE